MRTKTLLEISIVLVMGLLLTVKYWPSKQAKVEISMTDKKVLSNNPLERAYDRLALGMDRQEALAIMDEEYPLKNNSKYFSILCNTRGEYVWRWEWKKENSSNTAESATLTITFTRESDEGYRIMCKIANAIYEYKNGPVTIRKGLRVDSPKI